MVNKTIGVIGLGSIGMRHAINLRGLGCRVYGYDPQPSLSAMDREGIAYRGLNDLFGSVDAYIVASPTSEHWEQADNCMDMMGAHVFVEKPIGDVPHPKMRLVDMVGYNLRFHSCVKKAKEWLDSGVIGQPLWANFTCAQYNDKPAYRRDGVILNWSHEIDLALYLLGPAVVSASSTKLQDGQDVMTDILLTHDSGEMTRIHLDYLTIPERRGFIISGTKAAIECDLPSRKIRLWREKPEPWIASYGSYDQDYIDEMQAFLDRIDGKTTIGCTGEEALKVLEICLEVRKQAGL